MRIRQVKPAFWSDSKVAALAPTIRLFYIGLWMIADDAGYFRADVSEIARDLYGYEPRARREANVRRYLDHLQAAGRVELLPCGAHGIVPRLGDHQHLAARDKQVRTVDTEHAREASQIPAETRGNPAGKVKVGEGNGRVGGVPRTDPHTPLRGTDRTLPVRRQPGDPRRGVGPLREPVADLR
jgi:hypothetical protein